jgi:crotonobetainyl-CoA:carnitine CoA-transferase CaiB-like acyl-CoA transferase
MTTPLAGLRVLELARILAGPWAGQTLADLGAEVIKVEAPRRRRHPPLGSALRGARRRYLRRLFPQLQPGQDIRHRRFPHRGGPRPRAGLAREADVLIENFKLGGLAKYGLDYDSLSAVNPG